MQLNLLAIAIPLFITFMMLEYWISKKQGKQYFHFASSVSNLNVGIAERVMDTFVTGAFFFVYDYLHRHYAIFDIQANWMSWVFLLLCTDLVWYWYHRLGHEVNLLWSLHIVHHQSEDFNYTAATRVTIFQAVARTCFWAILPVIGFPAHMITLLLLAHGLYPFFVHTRTIGKLGWLEYIFVTPSHHRVHHASNEHYLDKNYGDIFIFWDKIFGTFTEEKEEPVYGLTKPLESHSFLWQHFHYQLELYFAMKRTKGLAAKMRILFGRPDTVDAGIRPALERKFRIYKNPRNAPIHLNRYVLGQVIFVLITLFLFILFEYQMGWYPRLLIAAFILLTVINCGAILERRKWIFHVEFARTVVVLAGLTLYYPALPILFGLTVFLLLHLYYFNALKQKYFRLVYLRDEG